MAHAAAEAGGASGVPDATLRGRGLQRAGEVVYQIETTANLFVSDVVFPEKYDQSIHQSDSANSSDRGKKHSGKYAIMTMDSIAKGRKGDKYTSRD